MKPVSADTPDPPGQMPGPAGARGPGRSWLRDETGVRAALASFSLFLIAVAGAFLLRDAAAPLRATHDDRVDRYAVGTIKLAPEGKLCRQMTLDNRTGRMVDHGRLPCDKSPLSDPKEELKDLKELHSGSRIEVIRDSFRSR